MSDPAPTEILIVDDSRTQAELLRYLLETNGFAVRAAANGAQALTAVRERRPELVISDIVMPDMDGYELCQTIKRDASLRSIPVILLTTLSDVDDIVRGLQAEADYYLTKPYDGDYLLSRVRVLLTERPVGENGDQLVVKLNGERHIITTGKRQMLNLLISTYESAIQQNRKLSDAQLALQQQQEQLAHYAEELAAKNTQMEEDLHMARELQTALLPAASFGLPKGAAPADQRLRVAHHYRPATIIGGDFFDILPLSETEAGIFIGDVMGHGVRPALITTLMRGLAQELRPLAREPGEFMTKINDGLAGILRQTDLPIFASGFYLVADTAAGELRFANAGHPSPLLLRAATGIAEPLRPPGAKRGMALGMFEGATYATSTVPLVAGDRLFLFTDGLFEVEGANSDFFDEQRLLAAVQSRLHLPLEALFEDLLAEMRQFSITGDFDDDVCLVGVAVEKTGPLDEPAEGAI